MKKNIIAALLTASITATTLCGCGIDVSLKNGDCAESAPSYVEAEYPAEEAPAAAASESYATNERYEAYDASGACEDYAVCTEEAEAYCDPCYKSVDGSALCPGNYYPAFNSGENYRTVTENSFKDVVTDYYTHHCDEIIRKAQTAAQLGNYDEAIYQLVSVPPVCQSCSDLCSAEAATIYQQKINAKGEQLLRQATMKWQTSKDKATAIAVANLLLQIAPRSSAYPKSQQLQGEIEQKLENTRINSNSRWAFLMP